MSRQSALIALGVAALLLAPAAHAQCPSTLNDAIYSPATDLARSWTVLDILLASENGGPPPQWLPHTVDTPAGPPLSVEGEDNPALSANGDTPEKRWEAAYARALERFHAHATACTADEFVAPLEGAWSSDAFGDPTALEALERYAQKTQPRSVLISRSVGHLGGLPTTRPFVLALSQTVTRGQPGLAPSLALSPLTQDKNAFLRHLVISASGLIINPDVPPPHAPVTAGGEVRPVFASMEASAGTSSDVRVDDWYNLVLANSVANVDALNEIRKATLRQLVLDYAAAKPGEELARQRGTFSALRQAAFRNFRGDVFTYYERRYIEPHETRKTTFDWSLSLRARYTLDATWVAEVADLAAFGLEGLFDFQFADTHDFKFSLTGGLLASASGYPTAQGWVRPDLLPSPEATAAWGGLADANLGLSLYVPTEGSGSLVKSARLTLLGLARGQARETGHTLRFGFNATLEIPVSDNVAIAGSYTLRCLGRGVCVSSSGLTFAVAGLD